jgi:hypothetical protein
LYGVRIYVTNESTYIRLAECIKQQKAAAAEELAAAGT